MENQNQRNSPQAKKSWQYQWLGIPANADEFIDRECKRHPNLASLTVDIRPELLYHDHGMDYIRIEVVLVSEDKRRELRTTRYEGAHPISPEIGAVSDLPKIRENILEEIAQLNKKITTKGLTAYLPDIPDSEEA